VDTAGPGSGADHDRTRSAEDVREYAQRMRSLPVEQVIAGVVFSPAQCRPGQTGAARRPVADRLGHRGARARASLSVGRGHQANRPGAGTTAAGSGERRGPREPARRAGGERPRPGSDPAVGRCSAVTCLAGRPASCGFLGADPY